MLKEDLQMITLASQAGKVKSIVLFGAYGKDEGNISDGKADNDIDIVVVSPDEKVLKYLRGLKTSVPVDIILMTEDDMKMVEPSQMWWEIRYGSILLVGEPIKLPNWKSWEIPFADAVASINKRCISMLIGKHEMMKKQADWNKVMSQIGKGIIAIGDATLIRRGRFDHRYAIRNLMLMHDAIYSDYSIAVSHKILHEPEMTPDQLWQMWGRTVLNLRNYVTENELKVPNLDPLIGINETTTQEEIAEVIKQLGAESWL